MIAGLMEPKRLEILGFKPTTRLNKSTRNIPSE